MGQENLPTRGKFVNDTLVNLYQSSINQLISDIGRTITLFLPPSASGCPNCLIGFDGSSQGIYDSSNPFVLNGPLHKPFPDGGICPVCRGTHQILTSVTSTYTALITTKPKDLDFTAIGEEIDPNTVVRTKTQIVAFEDIKIAEKSIIDGDTYVRITYPRKRGIRDLAYVATFWQRINK